MKRKGLLIGGLAIGVVLFIIAFLFLNNTPDAVIPEDKMSEFPGRQTSSGGVETIKDALTGKKTVECRFITEQGQRVVAYVKDGQIRADIDEINDKNSGSLIVKDLTMYFWNDTQAYQKSVTNEELDPGRPAPGAPGGLVQDLIQNFEKYKQFCNDAEVPSSVFALPSGIKFEESN